AVELLSVIEVLTHRIGFGGMLVKDVQAQLARPPVTVRRTATSGVIERTLPSGCHGALPGLGRSDFVVGGRHGILLRSLDGIAGGFVPMILLRRLRSGPSRA